jgi:2-desacetyl-2-hydroxyethyl bacteriochlorophyllide A dehydrogenase
MHKNKLMKSLVCNKPGNFEYKTAELPKIENGKTLLKIKRVGICGTDLHAFEGTQPYFNYPRILGHEIAATIENTNAIGFSNGDAVTIIPYFNCGNCIACKNDKPNCCTQINVCGVHIDGAMQEFLLVPDYSLVQGNTMTFEELVLIEPLAIGAHAVKKAKVQKNDFVLVIGAGPIGIGIMEFSKIEGAQVIAMDINDDRLSFCKTNLKIPYTINAQKENIKELLQQITNTHMPTTVIDATGSLNAINKGFDYMAHGATYVLVGLQKEFIQFSHPEFHKREGTLMSSRNATRADFEHVLHCMKNKLITPTTYITHRVSFDDIANQFANLLLPENNVIKAIVNFD